MIENTNVYVDEASILHNYNILRTLINEDTKVLAVIKANGYGLGLVQVAKTCEKLGIDVLCVLDLPQAIELREAGITMPIQLLGSTLLSELSLLVKYDLIQMIPDLEYAKAMDKYGLEHGVKLKGHIKVNTGLNRLGMSHYSDIRACYDLESINIGGIYTHFVQAQNGSEEGIEFSKIQIDHFKSILDQLNEEGINVGMTHMQNSPSVLQFGNLGFDAVRVGMILFGLFHPEQLEQARNLGFKETLKLSTHIAQIRNIEAGESIGYGRSYIATKPMKIATIASGYCDGIMKNLSLNGGQVVVNDTLCPILGDIAMSQFMIDVSDVDCKREDEVIFFGHDLLNVYDYIAITNQSINELISHLRYTLPRVYKNII